MVVADTHVIIWDTLKPDMLSQNAKKALDAANKSEGIIFCEISLWEIAMLMNKKRLQLDCGYVEFIRLLPGANKYILKGITSEIAETSVKIKDLKGNPADRIIAATSVVEKAELVTADKGVRKSGSIKTIWQGVY